MGRYVITNVRLHLPYHETPTLGSIAPRSRTLDERRIGTSGTMGDPHWRWPPRAAASSRAP
jgi:hypothetical protein